MKDLLMTPRQYHSPCLWICTWHSCRHLMNSLLPRIYPCQALTAWLRLITLIERGRTSSGRSSDMKRAALGQVGSESHVQASETMMRSGEQRADCNPGLERLGARDRLLVAVHARLHYTVAKVTFDGLDTVSAVLEAWAAATRCCCCGVRVVVTGSQSWLDDVEQRLSSDCGRCKESAMARRGPAPRLPADPALTMYAGSDSALWRPSRSERKVLSRRQFSAHAMAMARHHTDPLSRPWLPKGQELSIVEALEWAVRSLYQTGSRGLPCCLEDLDVDCAREVAARYGGSPSAGDTHDELSFVTS